jgi:hypothetical protein
MAVTMFWLKSQTPWLQPAEGGPERRPVKCIFQGMDCAPDESRAMQVHVEDGNGTA